MFMILSFMLPTSSRNKSWDNLVKARLAIRTREYIVWSNYMRDELLRYYKEIDAANNVITGKPQFELY